MDLLHGSHDVQSPVICSTALLPFIFRYTSSRTYGVVPCVVRYQTQSLIEAVTFRPTCRPLLSLRPVGGSKYPGKFPQDGVA